MNGFEQAIHRKEIPQYFRGEGEYFARDPDWGTQLHIINWGEICGHLERIENPTQVLKKAFEEFLYSVKNMVHECFDLLEHILCYYSMRRKVPCLSENGFDLIRDLCDKEKIKISDALSFLKLNVQGVKEVEGEDLFYRWIKKIISYGGPDMLKPF